MATKKPLPCQRCGDIRIIEFFGAGGKDEQYRVGCTCGHADFTAEWHKTKAEAIREWNKIALEW